MKPLNHEYTQIRKPPNRIDIELITIKPNAYTSLRDIIAADENSPASPTCRKSDVPIRNQLVKQAAMEYLQPFSMPEEDGLSWGKRMKASLNRCFGEDDDGIGCLGEINDVVLGRFFRVLRMERRTEAHRD